MKLKNPITYDGKIYDECYVQLISGHVPLGHTCSQGVNLYLLPARVKEDGEIETCPGAMIPVVNKADIKGSGTPKELQDFNAINEVVVGHLLYRDLVVIE
jgi:hypothetical protein